eukprot:GFYU01004139.1.p1 GENE.GFYU01004139.1~~GFYU01004139.1.p1  ORF type:complete len:764 (-),score=136.71 GFYU01004139.1:207-2498(-)
MLLMLPHDLLLCVLSHLEHKDLCCVATTCKTLHACAEDNELWKALVLQYIRTTGANHGVHGVRSHSSRMQSLLNGWREADSLARGHDGIDCTLLSSHERQHDAAGIEVGAWKNVYRYILETRRNVRTTRGRSHALSEQTTAFDLYLGRLAVATADGKIRLSAMSRAADFLPASRTMSLQHAATFAVSPFLSNNYDPDYSMSVWSTGVSPPENGNNSTRDSPERSDSPGSADSRGGSPWVELLGAQRMSKVHDIKQTSHAIVTSSITPYVQVWYLMQSADGAAGGVESADYLPSLKDGTHTWEYIGVAESTQGECILCTEVVDQIVHSIETLQIVGGDSSGNAYVWRPSPQCIARLRSRALGALPAHLSGQGTEPGNIMDAMDVDAETTTNITAEFQFITTHVLKGHKDLITHIHMFCPSDDGRRSLLATTSWDSSIRLWQIGHIDTTTNRSRGGSDASVRSYSRSRASSRDVVESLVRPRTVSDEAGAVKVSIRARSLSGSSATVPLGDTDDGGGIGGECSVHGLAAELGIPGEYGVVTTASGADVPVLAPIVVDGEADSVVGTATGYPTQSHGANVAGAEEFTVALTQVERNSWAAVLKLREGRTCVSVSCREYLLVAGCDDGGLRITDLSPPKGEKHMLIRRPDNQLYRHVSSNTIVSLDVGKNYIVVACDDGKVVCLDRTTVAIVWVKTLRCHTAMLQVYDDFVVGGSADGQVFICDLRTGEDVLTQRLHHSALKQMCVELPWIVTRGFDELLRVSDFRP